MSGGGTITINGGTVTAAGGNYSVGIGPGESGGDSGAISLSWTDKDNDSITASSYGGNVKFQKEFALDEERDTALTPDTISKANGKKIVPFDTGASGPILIDSVTVTGIDAPVAAEALDTDAETYTENVTLGGVTWEPSDDTAGYGLVYAASVTATAAENYAFADDVSATINGETASVTKNADGTLTITSPVFPETERGPVTITSIGREIVYSEEAIDISASGLFEIPPEAGTAAYIVENGTGEGTFGGGKLTVKKAGSFTVTVITAETEHYHGGTASAKLVVNKADITPSVSIAGWTYGETANSPSVTGNTGGGAVTYTYAVKGGAEFSETVPYAVGEYTVKATIAATDNYNGGEATADFAINKADIAPSVSIEGWTYGESVNSPSVTGNTGDGVVTYTYTVKGGAEFSETVPTDVGEYTVKATIAATDNYNGGEVTADFAISKADITPTVSIAGWTYGETANSPSVTGNTGDGAVTYAYAVKGGADFSETVPSAVGEYTVKATIAATDNYNGGEATADFTITPSEPTEEPGEPVIYTVSFNLNGHGSDAPASQRVESGQYATVPSAPANEGDFTFGGWTDAPEDGVTFQFDVTPVTSDLTLYAVWIENLPEAAGEDVTETDPTVGETEVDMSSVSAATRPEDMEALKETAQSVQMAEAESAEEQAVQNAALQDAVDSIDEETKQQENQSAVAALIAAGLVQQNEDGSVPESTEIEVIREVYMEVQAKGLVEETVEGVARKLLSVDINPFYNVLANIAGSTEEAVPVSGGNPTTINKPIDLSVELPEDFIPADRSFAYVNHEHNGEDYTYRALLDFAADGIRTLSFRAMGLSPFEITTDTMGAAVTVDVGGVSIEMGYATLMEAVDAVEDNGTITIVESVTADIVSSSKTYTLVLGEDVTGAYVSADDVTLTVDGKAVTFKDGKAVILAADAPGENPGDQPGDNPGGDSGSGSASRGGCYVATAVYGSYDCPEVWTLRRFRDEVLAETWYGRLFIRAYYTVSPTAVKWFGDCEWFQNFFRDRLDKMVSGLQTDGFESTPYQDLEW